MYDFKTTCAIKFDKKLQPDSNIVLIVVDNESFEAVEDLKLDFGRWPWQRDISAEGMEYIFSAEPKAVLSLAIPEVKEDPVKDQIYIDVISNAKNYFPAIGVENFRISALNALKNRLIKDKNLNPAKLLKLSDKQYDNLLKSKGLDRIIRIIYQRSLKSKERKQPNKRFSLDVDWSTLSEESSVIDYISFLTFSSVPEIFQDAYKNIGVKFFSKAVDDVLRYDRPLYKFVDSDIFLPSIAMAPYIHLYGNGKAKLTKNYIEVGNKKIPIDDRGRYRINFRYDYKGYKKKNFVQAILSNRYEKGTFHLDDFKESKYYLDKSFLKDKYVILGSYRPDISSLRASTVPGHKGLSSLDVIGNILDNYLNCGPNSYERFIKPIPVYLAVIFTLLFCGLNYLFITKFETILLKLIGIFLGLFFYMLFAIHLFVNPSLRYDISLVVPAFIIFFVSLLTFFWQYKTVYAKRKEIEALFGKFISPQVKKALIENPSLVNYEGDKKEITVMFTDLRGFTSISEKAPISQTITQLNEYFAAMADIIIYEYNGTLDKYMGDAIMAFWGDPVPQENHPELAVRAAISMNQKLKEMNEIWAKNDWPVLNMGIGINTGEAIVGHLGGGVLLDYTVIGDNVNIASRLESLNKEYSTSIIISESTYNKCKNFIKARFLDNKQLKGKTELIKIYEVINLID